MAGPNMHSLSSEQANRPRCPSAASLAQIVRPVNSFGLLAVPDFYTASDCRSINSQVGWGVGSGNEWPRQGLGQRTFSMYEEWAAALIIRA